MTQESSFTDEERALWHRRRRLGLEGDSNLTHEDLDDLEDEREELDALDGVGGSEALAQQACIHCGAAIVDKASVGSEGGLCSACD